MVLKTEGKNAGEFLISEAHGDLSREKITIAAEQTLQAGHVLAKINPALNKAATISADADNAGAGTISMHTTPFTAAAKLGRYVARCITPDSDGNSNDAVFEVTDPAGGGLGAATQAVLFDEVIKFTIANAGASTPYVVGDTIYIDIYDAYAKAAAAMDVGNTGGATIALATPAVSADVLGGVYSLEVISTSGGITWSVTDPLGKALANATTGVAYTGDVKFTITAAGAASVVGDLATVTVNLSADDSYFVEFNPAGTDGSEVPAAILYPNVTTGVGETAKAAGIVRLATVRESDLVWKAGTTPEQKLAALKVLAEKKTIVGR